MAEKSIDHILNTYTPEQLDVLSKFKNQIPGRDEANPLFDDLALLRFLKARKFDLKKSSEMWNNYLTFRKEDSLEESYDFPEFDVVKRHFPHFYFKTDKQGRPIYIERLGKINYNEIWKVTTKERFLKYYARHNERLITNVLPSCSEAAGKRLHQGVYIIDLNGMSLKTASSGVMDLAKALMGMCQKYYPEVMGEMYIVNAPMLFYGIWNIVKLWIDDRTKQKIHIMGSNYQKKLLEKIDAENLPDFLGGKATCQEYGEHLQREQGPWVRDVKETEIPLR
jgi:hypothetical protein